MNNFYKVFLSLLLVTLLFAVNFEEVFAAKKNNASSRSLKVYSNAGENTVYGSVLNPKEDEINILLPKTVVEKIRKAGQEKLTCNITSKLDTTKTYSVPQSSLSIQKKKVNKIAGKYLVISLFNLTTPSGITVSPSSLPADDYKVQILSDGVDLTTDSFNYKTPALVVGAVDSKTSALVTVEDLQGNTI